MLKKNLVSSVLTQVPLFVFGVLTGVFSTRILGDEGKGVVALFQANSQFFILLLSLGIQTGIVYFVSAKKIPEKIVVGMAAFAFVCAGFLLALFLALSKVFNFSELVLPVGYTSYFYLLLLFLLFITTLFNTILSGFFQAHSKFVLLNWISISISTLNLLLFAGLFFMVRNGSYNVAERINFILGTLLVSLLINSLVLVFYQRKKLQLKLSFQFKFGKHYKPFIFYNFSIYFGMFINFFNYRLDLWIINAYLDEKDLSYYSLAANIIQVILFISVAVGAVLLPDLTSKSKEERIYTFVRVSRLCFVFYSSICVFAFLVSGYVIPIAYGEEFANAVLPFNLLLPGALLASMMQLFYQFILSNGQNQWNILANLVGLIIACVGGFSFIPYYGIMGASIVTSICYFAIFVTCFYFVVKIIGTRNMNIFIPTRKELHYLTTLLKVKK